MAGPDFRCSANGFFTPSDRGQMKVESGRKMERALDKKREMMLLSLHEKGRRKYCLEDMLWQTIRTIVGHGSRGNQRKLPGSFPRSRFPLTEISARQLPEPGRRQVAFNVVETLLCYGLFYILDPHRYGGANIDKVPLIVRTLAAFFRSTSGSITNKMLNLDGSRLHSARYEPLLFAHLASEQTMYQTLYREILRTARNLSSGEETLPDFLDYLHDGTKIEELFGQEDLANSPSRLQQRMELS
jgi:hypothetical protein